jgi:hypothetical protein
MTDALDAIRLQVERDRSDGKEGRSGCTALEVEWLLAERDRLQAKCDDLATRLHSADWLMGLEHHEGEDESGGLIQRLEAAEAERDRLLSVVEAAKAVANEQAKEWDGAGGDAWRNLRTALAALEEKP